MSKCGIKNLIKVAVMNIEVTCATKYFKAVTAATSALGYVTKQRAAYPLKFAVCKCEAAESEIETCIIIRITNVTALDTITARETESKVIYNAAGFCYAENIAAVTYMHIAPAFFRTSFFRTKIKLFLCNIVIEFEVHFWCSVFIKTLYQFIAPLFSIIKEYISNIQYVTKVERIKIFSLFFPIKLYTVTNRTSKLGLGTLTEA